MKRVYVLLRDNRQSGPFTIAELFAQQLNSTDLLWLEGKSIAWTLLSEIELNVPAISEARSKKTTSAKDNPTPGEVEKKATAVKKKPIEFQPLNQTPLKENLINGERHFFIPVTGEEPIDFVDHRKEKSKMVSDVAMTALIVVMFSGGLYGGRFLFSSNTNTENSTVSNTVSASQHAAKTNITTATDNYEKANNMLPNTNKDSSAKIIFSPKLRVAKKPVRVTVIPAENALATSNATTKETSKENIIAVSNPEKVENKVIVSAKEETFEKENTEKKKGFLKKLFGKKKE